MKGEERGKKKGTEEVKEKRENEKMGGKWENKTEEEKTYMERRG